MDRVPLLHMTYIHRDCPVFGLNRHETRVAPLHILVIKNCNTICYLRQCTDKGISARKNNAYLRYFNIFILLKHSYKSIPTTGTLDVLIQRTLYKPFLSNATMFLRKRIVICCRWLLGNQTSLHEWPTVTVM
jgi:hypothetical protein